MVNGEWWTGSAAVVREWIRLSGFEEIARYLKEKEEGQGEKGERREGEGCWNLHELASLQEEDFFAKLSSCPVSSSSLHSLWSLVDHYKKFSSVEGESSLLSLDILFCPLSCPRSVDDQCDVMWCSSD